MFLKEIKNVLLKNKQNFDEIDKKLYINLMEIVDTYIEATNEYVTLENCYLLASPEMISLLDAVKSSIEMCGFKPFPITEKTLDINFIFNNKYFEKEVTQISNKHPNVFQHISAVKLSEDLKTVYVVLKWKHEEFGQITDKVIDELKKLLKVSKGHAVTTMCSAKYTLWENEENEY